eukprot:6922365-Prymnesium_polylepis.1
MLSPQCSVSLSAPSLPHALPCGYDSSQASTNDHDTVAQLKGFHGKAASGLQVAKRVEVKLGGSAQKAKMLVIPVGTSFKTLKSLVASKLSFPSDDIVLALANGRSDSQLGVMPEIEAVEEISDGDQLVVRPASAPNEVGADRLPPQCATQPSTAATQVRDYMSSRFAARGKYSCDGMRWQERFVSSLIEQVDRIKEVLGIDIPLMSMAVQQAR